MARSISIVLALILNCCDIYVFRNGAKTSSGQSKHIFQVACFFLLADMKLYPKTFRKTHWIVRHLVELFLSTYLYETWLCDFWDPIESFTSHSLTQIVAILKKRAPRNGKMCSFICSLSTILLSKHTATFINSLTGSFFLLTIMHGTRAVDFSILRNEGILGFFNNIKERLIRLVKKTIQSITGGEKKPETCCGNTRCFKGGSKCCAYSDQHDTEQCRTRKNKNSNLELN